MHNKFLLNRQTQPIAIRSLLSEHHANNRVPDLVKITWFLGKRCNYDCSYCTPHTHDAVSPHLPMTEIENLVNSIHHQMTVVGKKASYWISGGEPFMHPKIFDILALVRSKDTTDDLFGVNSNGSFKLEFYQRALEYLSHINLSIHLEQPDDVVWSTCQKLVSLHQQFPDKSICTNLLLLPGRVQQVKEIKSYLKDNGIDLTVRRIKPNTFGIGEELVPPGTSRKVREFAKLSRDFQVKIKSDYKSWKDSHVKQWYKEYYTPEELDFFVDQENLAGQQTMGVWTANDEYIECSGDDIISHDVNVFTGWQCFTGTDNIFIEFDGSVYNGACLVQPMGSAHQGIEWPIGPVTCTRFSCSSTPDINIRKCRDSSLLPLITDDPPAN